MAITKIHAIKSTLGKALAYIENPDKTDGQMLVSGYNCEPQTASIDFEMTAVLAHKARNLKRKRSTNLAYHLIQSFSPEDAVTPEQAHELGKKLAFEYTGGKYEYVVATHIDKGHIHNHIMINAVSFYDYTRSFNRALIFSSCLLTCFSHTNVYRFALLSILVPSTNTSECSVYPLFSSFFTY